jgi:precorrin-6B methylase 2
LAELDDLELVLGARPVNALAGKASLDAALIAGGLDDRALLRWAWRSAKRQSLLWPAWAERYERRLTPIADEYLPSQERTDVV